MIRFLATEDIPVEKAIIDAGITKTSALTAYTPRLTREPRAGISIRLSAITATNTTGTISHVPQKRAMRKKDSTKYASISHSLATKAPR